MSTLGLWLASNLVMASFLACLAAAVQRWGRRPALAHGLWLLVLIKLITPPLVTVPLPFPLHDEHAESALSICQFVSRSAPDHRVDEVPVADETPAAAGGAAARLEPVEPPRDGNDQVEAVEPTPLAIAGHEIALPAPLALKESVASDAAAESPAGAIWDWLPQTLASAWLAGSLLWLGVAASRLLRFHKSLRLGHAAAAALQEQAQTLAGKLGIRCPQLWIVPGCLSPLLWGFGPAPRLVLPEGLVGRLSGSQLASLLVHELAHLRRRDHWARWLELATLALYWWCPLAWWASACLHEAEEECCDAWVLWTLPDVARDYALALLETVDFLSGAAVALPPCASGMAPVRFLKRRLTMILRGKTQRALTLGGVALLAVLGAVLLPVVPGWGQAKPGDDPIVAEPRTRTDKAEPTAGDLLKEIQRVHAEMKRAQEEFARHKKMFDDHMAEMSKHLDKLKVHAATAAPMDPKRPLAPKVPLTPKAAPAFGFPGGGMTMGGGDINHRLAEMERKLDQVLKELQTLRARTGGPGPGGPPPGPGRPGFPGAVPGGGLLPPPPIPGTGAVPAPPAVPVVPPAPRFRPTGEVDPERP